MAAKQKEIQAKQIVNQISQAHKGENKKVGAKYWGRLDNVSLLNCFFPFAQLLISPTIKKYIDTLYVAKSTPILMQC